MTQARVALRSAVLIAGPTCSGKSALAIDVAQRIDGVIINADSMQLYREIPILSARPSECDEKRVPHRLYGVLPAAQAGSVAWWRQQALTEMEAVWADGRIPIICGGTGMYFRALTHGLAEIPDPGEQARHQARNLLAQEGPAALHSRLLEVDAQTARKLRPTDSQRLSRAWEVWVGTGKSLAEWQSEPGLPAADCKFVSVRLAPPREVLRQAIARRFDLMLDQGAVAEVRHLLKLRLPNDLPAMRAVGVAEISAALRGDFSLQEAASKAVIATGQYIKRQTTWFSRQALAGEENSLVWEHRWGDVAQLLERNLDKIVTFIRGRIDGGAHIP